MSNDGKDYAAMAKLMWDGMNESEQTGVRFGLFPAEAMRVAEKEWGYTDGVKLCVELMSCAKADGGMRA